MRITIVMIAKDDEAHIGRALESIVPQLGPECELVCVDDCSHDSTKKLMMEASDASKCVRVLSTAGKQRRGVAAARNLGAAIARGDYIYHVDSDDWLVGGAVTRMVAATNGSPEIVRVPHAEQFNEEECRVRPVREKTLEEQAFGPLAPWAKMVRRDRHVEFPECDVKLCLNPAWHFLQSDNVGSYAYIEGAPCYVWDRTVPGAGTRTVEWSDSHPRFLEQVAFTDELEKLGLMKTWPADFLRSLALMMDIGPRLKRPHVRAAWETRLRAEFGNLMTGRYVH